MAEQTKACGHYRGALHRHCGSTEGVRLYLAGPRCAAHSPTALAGEPEPGQTAHAATPRGTPTGGGTPAPDVYGHGPAAEVA